jgi:hypothetical protein
MERLLQEEREKNSNLFNEVTKYSTMVEEKNELINNLREESNKYKEDFEKLNGVILSKLTALLNKPNGQPQNMEEINRLLSSVNKLDKDISFLRQNNKEIINKHENNFYLLKDQLNKATNEMKNSKRVETITKTVVQPPIRERIIRTPPVVKRVIKASPSPARVYREIPTSSTIRYQNKYTCNCNRMNNHINHYTVEKCPICNVGLVNTIKSNSRLSENPNQSNNFVSGNQSIRSNVFTEKLTGKSYQRRLSTEPLKNSTFSNQYYIKNSTIGQEQPLLSRKSAKYSVEPLHKRISHKIRKSNNGRISTRELDPYLMSETVKKSENIKGVEVRKSYSRR